MRFVNHNSDVFKIPGDRKKNALFSQRSYNYKHLRNETLAIAGQEYVKVFVVRYKIIAKTK